MMLIRKHNEWKNAYQMLTMKNTLFYLHLECIFLLENVRSSLNSPNDIFELFMFMPRNQQNLLFINSD